MRLAPVLLAALIPAGAIAPARAAMITQYLSGTISGASTVDHAGYFSPAGTDLAGAPIELHFQYEPADFKTIGCGAPAGSSCAMYFSKPGGAPGSLAHVPTSGSVLISVEINGVRRSFAPFLQGMVYVFNTPGSPGQLQVGADYAVAAGTPQALVNLYYAGQTAFGALLSPANHPVNVNNAGYANNNNFTVYIPVPGSKQRGPETLTLSIAKSGR